MHTSMLVEIARANRTGEKKGILTVDSDNAVVIKAFLLQALEDGFPAVVETSANNFDLQITGVGSRLIDFHNKIKQIAASVGYPPENLFFGLYDLIPEDPPAAVDNPALKKPRPFINELIRMGFSVFGMRAKEALNGELINEIETAAINVRDADKPVYVIDLENEREIIDDERTAASEEDQGKLTDRIKKTINERGYSEIMERLLAVRINLGQGHDGAKVLPFSKTAIHEIGAGFQLSSPTIFGAQNLNYQPQSVLDELVESHFAFMRVGSELTYTMREAAFSLAMVENETLQGSPGVYLSNLIGELDKAMQAAPQMWTGFYKGNGFEQLLDRKYSLYDRSRFFWNDKDVQVAWQRLFDNLRDHPIPLNVLRQFLPRQFERVILGEVENTPEALVLDAIQYVLRRYSNTCGWRPQK